MATAKDNRLYAKFTLDFMDHPKIAGLSDAAFRALVDAIIWSRRQQTDGFLARRLALAKWSLEILQELCNNDDEKPSLIEREEGWYVHDFATIQDTKAEIEARRARAVSAGQKGGLAKAKRPAKRTASKSPSKRPSENVAETETETYISSSYVEPPSHVSNAREKTGAEAAVWSDSINLPAVRPGGVDADRIVEAFGASLATPMEAGLRTDVKFQINSCLDAGAAPPAVIAGLREWTDSGSWSPTQIPKFVHKANNRGTNSGRGKPTAKAMGYDDALAQLLREVETL